jgi:hypothetical protein
MKSTFNKKIKIMYAFNNCLIIYKNKKFEMRATFADLNFNVLTIFRKLGKLDFLIIPPNSGGKRVTLMDETLIN